MTIRNLALLGLVAFSSQLSSATRIGSGPRHPWARGLNETTSSQDLTLTESPSPSSSSLRAGNIVGTESTILSRSEDPPSSDPSQESSGAPTEQPEDTTEIPGKITPSNKPDLSTEIADPSDSNDGGHSTGSGEPGEGNPSSSLVTSNDGGVCTSLGPGEVKTVFSIIYTETVTWTGDPSDYTPPHPTMDVPTYCDSDRGSQTTAPPEAPSGNATSTRDDSQWHTACLTETNGTTICYTEPYFNPSFIFSSRPKSADATTAPVDVTQPFFGAPDKELAPTSTFFVTSKNPSVVFPPSKTPDYGAGNDGGSNGGNGGGNNHNPVDNTPSPKPPYESMLVTDPERKGVTITAEPTRIIINDKTLSNLNPTATTRVTVGNGIYEINPSQIIQLGGKTIDRGVGRGLQVAAPTSAVLDGLPVTVSGGSVVIGGYTYTIGATPETRVVLGRTVVIGPTGISFRNTDASITYEGKVPEQTGVIVAGGELMTAIGKSVVVLVQTTITYGASIAPQTETIDDDTVVIGPSDVVVHGTAVGGDRLGPSQTKYDIVGGATLTQVGASRVVIKDTTYTVGPGTGTTTTFVGGENVTIAPDGITVATLTIPYPFGPTIVTMLPIPSETAAPAEGDDEEDLGISVRPDWAAGITALSIAIGVWALGFAI
ncbi:hypothetical protein jhhlp_003661 [Lomentospora prolificans]|uniref:Uncharacterized protein n=1 Tax=Lomentospora prolificans TaxID=41688 RepID=A0A2N3N9C7_9PEZI|nr:hypothetical protein jhhlp_003661 [Lomentospora prolificans]